MPSVFETTTKRVVKCMDPRRKMIPVRSPVDADRFECLCLVRKSRLRYSPCWNSLKIKDIVETEESDDLMEKESAGSEDGSPAFQFEDQVDSQVSAEIQRPKIIVKGDKSTVQEVDISVQKYSINQKFLNSLNNRKLKSELPPLFEKIHEKQEDLFLVTETLKNVEQKTLTNNCENTILSQLKCIAFIWKHDSHSKLTIPSNQVLAYRVEKLFFHEKDVMNLYLNKKKSFPKADNGVGLRSNSSSEDSRNVKEVAQDMVESLQDLTEKQKEDMLYCLTQCLHKDKWLQDLEQKVFEVLYSNALLDESEEELKFHLSCLFDECGTVLTERAETVHTFLESLIELSEERQIVAKILEEGNLTQLKEEIEHLLEQSGEEPLEVVIQDVEKKTLVMFYLVVTILLHLSGKCSVSA